MCSSIRIRNLKIFKVNMWNLWFLENDFGDSQSTSSSDDDDDSDFAPDPDTPTKEYPDAGRIAEMMDVRRKNVRVFLWGY